MYAIGVDIGATKTNFVLLNLSRLNLDRFKVVREIKVLTPKTKKEIIRILEENIRCLIPGIKQSEISGIGIGVPGPVSPNGDLILNPPNLTCLKNYPLAKIVEKELKTKTVMENDVNCFTLAEARLGAGRGARVVFGITLGTGVGGGLVMNNEIYGGSRGAAGEVGHMTIKFDGPKCSCGSVGCLEEYCSERFFTKKVLKPKEIEDRAREGNKKALEIWKEYGRYLGIGLSNVINLLDPEVIVIGGGIARADKFFLSETKKEVKKRVISPLSKKYVKIRMAQLGDFANAIGAALLL